MGNIILEAESRRQLRDDLLGPLHLHFLAAEQAYRDYQANGKSFLFACSLRRTNASARELLFRHGHLLPPERCSDALALLRHYDVWLTLWDDLASNTRPTMHDAFAFENAITFPKEAQLSLMKLYKATSEVPKTELSG